MAHDQHTNLASALILTAPSPSISGLSLTLVTGKAARFPVAPFNCVLCPPDVTSSLDNSEIVRVTQVVGDTFTITRAQESTTAKAVIAGWTAFNAPTVKVFTDLEADIAARQPRVLVDELTSTAYVLVVRDGTLILRESV